MPAKCPDCIAENITNIRHNPYPAGRCYTHHREKKKRDSARKHELYVQRTYNMPEGEYDRLYEFQGGKCAGCRRATGATRALSVDHDHKCCPETPTCGACTRGLLCRPCNDALGHFRDDPELFRNLAEYLEDPPARRLVAA